MRPIINGKNEPANELANYIAKSSHNCLHLPNVYNKQNTIHLETGLRYVEINENVGICSLVIDNTYTDITESEDMNIII
jgi:hypothetical protein